MDWGKYGMFVFICRSGWLSRDVRWLVGRFVGGRVDEVLVSGICARVKYGFVNRSIVCFLSGVI